MSNLIRKNEQQQLMPPSWEPLRLMRDLMGFDPFAEMFPTVNRSEAMTFAPRFEVKETKDAYLFKADLPGIEEKDIDVRVENNTLTVQGERKIEKEEKEENYRRVERQYGSFTRTFTLPQTVDSEKVSANYDKGVLKISLPKKAEAKPKQIKVNIGSEKGERTLEGKGPGKAA